MSSQGSIVNVPSATIGTVQPPAALLQHMGSIYRATLSSVADNETQAIAIDAFGRQIVIGSAADNSAFVDNPVGVGGIYNSALPTYDDGDQVTDQHDASGRKIVNDDQVLASLAARFGLLGQKASAASAPVVLSTEQEAKVDLIAREATLTALSAKFNSLGQKASAASAPFVLSTEQEAKIDLIAREATLTALSAKFSSLGQKASAASAPFVLSTEQEAILSGLSAKFGSLGQKASAGSAPVVLSTEQEAILSGLSAKFGSLGQKASAGSAPVVLSSEQEAKLDSLIANSNDLGVLHAVYNAYSSTNLPGNATAPLELVASASANIKKISIWDTGGVPCEIMTGAAASEVRKIVVGPGADGEIHCDIPSGERISIRRIDNAAAVSVGDISINFLG